jgi:hypothetical protein
LSPFSVASTHALKLTCQYRRELLDQTLFWTTTDLEDKLQNYQGYYNKCRAHSGRGGVTPVESDSTKIVDLNTAIAGLNIVVVYFSGLSQP